MAHRPSSRERPAPCLSLARARRAAQRRLCARVTSVTEPPPAGAVIYRRSRMSVTVAPSPKSTVARTISCPQLRLGRSRRISPRRGSRRECRTQAVSGRRPGRAPALGSAGGAWRRHACKTHQRRTAAAHLDRVTGRAGGRPALSLVPRSVAGGFIPSRFLRRQRLELESDTRLGTISRHGGLVTFASPGAGAEVLARSAIDRLVRRGV